MQTYLKKEHTDYHILKTIENDASISQRKLSSQMDINVASINFALKRLIKKGFVRMVGANPRRLKYYVTPQGVREKTKLAYDFFGRNYHFYKEVKNDIESKVRRANGSLKKAVVIYGTNELSEITYTVVLSMRLEFAGFYTRDTKTTNKEIFGHKIQTFKALDKTKPVLLLLTDDFPEDLMSDSDLENIETLNLSDYYK